MMREIKFRGIQAFGTKAGRWLYGSLVLSKPDSDIGEAYGATIQNDTHRPINVKPETVGQYTGIKDKYGVEVYESDIVSWECLGGTVKGAVKCDSYIFFVAGFYLSYQDNPEDAFSENCQLEVIGNIHQNPELLKGEG